MTFELIDGEAAYACEVCGDAFNDIREADLHETDCGKPNDEMGGEA